MQNKFTSNQLESTYYQACMAELQALKPGNVHIFADGHGMTIDDFLQSAQASAAVIAKPNFTVGERILSAVEATQKAVGLNTNLGIILLCAPLIHAALQLKYNEALLTSLENTLSQLTINDAQLVAQAIILANPAGLGEVNEHDIRTIPTIDLLTMMQSAQDKDRIAWQYANRFEDVFNFGLTCYQKAFAHYQNQAWSTTALYLGFLTKQLDTHVIRKHGDALASQVLHEAQEKEAIYWTTNNPKLVQNQLLAWDASLKNRQLNPGTSADMTVATLFLKMLITN